MTREGDLVIIDYVNHRGERRERKAVVLGFRQGETVHHPGRQWLVDVLCCEKGERRAFALSGVKGWRAAT